jgi:hypothetical protein
LSRRQVLDSAGLWMWRDLVVWIDDWLC